MDEKYWMEATYSLEEMGFNMTLSGRRTFFNHKLYSLIVSKCWEFDPPLAEHLEDEIYKIYTKLRASIKNRCSSIEDRNK